MNTKKIEHIGIAVKDLEKTMNFYENILGLKKMAVETVEDQGVNIAFFQLGETKIELLEPLNSESPIAKFIDKRSEGIHHMAVLVEDIEAKIGDMKEKGARFIGDKPTKGADNMKIIFVHPKTTNGVLLELCEPLDEEDK
ncbi:MULTISPECIES: methylmalonyl-CoA epimerase [unclassified Halanaerobium]|uniref:methylmalonyl-CoA epimerase n=1 Tax=unclassified Halanaerobium TaxID=2641197 RepID=UPI000DF417D0|nr:MULTISPECIES: methylmalonyl-CoA epimerase [unclassified Halanaerobium]RCW48679.1 methylmalonyl-CoA epimerase [Halanaerobium sp. MA284_MarDTE_T2]RCW86577.1 methylmalonyl-CoA epimerase [Halanaerobium sp. DL-01]